MISFLDHEDEITYAKFLHGYWCSAQKKSFNLEVGDFLRLIGVDPSSFTKYKSIIEE